MSTHLEEITRGQRFEFGANWSRFLQRLNEDRIDAAVESLRGLLGLERLDGMTFLDVGSGSGLFSLAARRLGATVFSLDYDPKSVACTRHVQETFFPGDTGWRVAEGSVLDRQFMASLRDFDVVYSWGVLHHTGSMWQAIGNASESVKSGGLLALALYNDQGAMSKRWLKLKKIYNALPRFLRVPYTLLVMGLREVPQFFWLAVKLRPLEYFKRFSTPSGPRGMSYWHDMVDWIGGYPFEVAKPEEVFRFLSARGFELLDMHTLGAGLGCNEYIFRRAV